MVSDLDLRVHPGKQNIRLLRDLINNFWDKSCIKKEMTTAPSFSSADVERYRRLRTVSQRLNARISATVPREAFYAIGRAIGILRNGTLVFDDEGTKSVLMDCCIYDWMKDGKTVVQRYAESQAPPAGTDEHYLLQAYLKATFRILLPQSFLPGAGAQCRDALWKEDIFIMDLGLSQGASTGQDSPLAARTIPLGDCWMTSGAVLPTSSAAIAAAKQILEHEEFQSSEIPDSSTIALAMVRTSLKFGAAQRIRYQNIQSQSEGTGDHPTARPGAGVAGRNSPCPCGSGKRYKRCCGAR